MDKNIKILIGAIMIASALLMNAQENMTDGTSCNLPTPQTIYLTRPQGLDSAAFFNPYYYDCCDEHATTWYWLAGYRYNSTWDSERLAPCMFGDKKLVFAGSKAADLDETELVADFVGMAPNSHTVLSLRPQIQNHNFDMFVRYDLCNLSNWFTNAWVAIGGTLTVSQWDLHAREHSKPTENENQFSTFPPTYMSLAAAPVAGTLAKALGGTYTFGDMKTPIQYGKWNFGKQKKVGFANVDLLIGDDIIRQPKFHVGVFLKASAPTGNKPDPEWIFNPVVGNGHHWELGGGLDAHWTCWSCDEQCLQLYATGSITHLFNDTQWRSFDFKTFVGNDDCYSGAFSRYVLLKEFDNNNAYNGNLINAINFTTRKIQSSFEVQGDASLRLLYKNCGWAFGIGYNIFGRSAENINGPCESSDSVKDKRYGIKGMTGVAARAYFKKLMEETDPVNATESVTGMFNLAENGKNIEEALFVDNPHFMKDPGTGAVFLTWDSIPANPDDIAKNSVPPILVKDSDILFQGIPRMITHKLFAHLDYQFETCCQCWQPFIGIGGEVEFAQGQGCTRLCPADGACPNSSCEPRFWSLWIRGGMDF